MDYSNSLRPAFLTNTASELLKQPITALLTVSNDAANALNNIGIVTIFDLGSSQLFSAARQIKEATKIKDTELIQRFSGDLIDNAASGKKTTEIADSPISILRQLDETSATFIQNALSVLSIRELAAWPAYNTARAIINDAYGLSEAVIINDEERPGELIPIMRKYATEQVQYDIIVMDKVLENKELVSAMIKNLPPAPVRMKLFQELNMTREDIIGIDSLLTVYDKLKNDLILDGAIDVSDIVGAALIARPAIGAVLTYKQSWYPQGLALGHLLHSLALAPGESTRIAMVDWARTDRGTISEQTNQAENFAADVNHARSIGEVTSAVAKEAQNGFSKSESEATQEQSGTTSGQSSLFSKADGGVSLSEKDGLKGNAQFDLGVSSTGTSNANSRTHGWASSNSNTNGERTLNATMQQNINDKTQQASNSVRNRRATTVKETSQKESETLSTRVVTNYNHMHALTVQYFEVVQIYKVLLELSKVTPCLFLPMKLVTFTEDVIRRYKNVIASVGLIPEVRGLAFAEPNQLAIEILNKNGSWIGFDEIKTAFGNNIGTANSKNIFLPTSGLEFGSVGSWDTNFFDNYESIILTDKKGFRQSFNIYNAAESSNRNSPQYMIALSKQYQATRGGNILNGSYIAKASEIKNIIFKKKIDSVDFDDSFEVGLNFNVSLSNGKQASDIIDMPSLAIKGMIKPVKGEIETSVFSFQKSIADEPLINHLYENALHYSTAIWNSLDAATITTMLSSHTHMGKKLIENIDPVPVSIAGNYIIFRYYGVVQDEWKKFLNEKGLNKPAPIEDIIPLPSAGVFAEAVLGRSNAAEKLDITRFWNWQDSPIPILPTEIAALNAGGKNNPVEIQSGKLESPLVNIINPPALPDPVGLAPLYSAIANGNMFRDMSGMAQTSSLLQSAMQAAQSAAANAASTSGEAQKVAANQLTDILKIAAQIAAGGMGIPIGGFGGGDGNSSGSNTTQNLPATPTNKGLNVVAGQKLDDKLNTGNRGNAQQPDTGEWSPFPEQNTSSNQGLTPPPMLSAHTNESAALGLTNPTKKNVPFASNTPQTGTVGQSQYSEKQFKIVGKTFIGYVNDTDIGELPPPYPIGSPLALAAMGKFLNSVMEEFPENDDNYKNASGPARSKGYRLLSSVTFAIVHDSDKIADVKIINTDGDVGREPIMNFSPRYIQPDPLYFSISPTVTNTGTNIWELAWEVMGKPADIAEPPFQLIRERTSKYIWHKIRCEITFDANKGVPVVNPSIVGSQFPSHIVFKNGTPALGGYQRQKELARLWYANPTDNKRVE
jgi:hypothetical protein